MTISPKRLDALGNEIIIGNVYGYSTTDTVFVGMAFRFTETRVTLELISRKFFVYGEEIAKDWAVKNPYPSVPSYHLFPVRTS